MDNAHAAFLAHAKKVAECFVGCAPSQVVLLHHNDTDGLTSGAIVSAALERLAIPTFRYCLEKPYPQVLRLLFDNTLLPKDSVFIFVDFASGMLPEIARLNAGRFKVFVLDHHGIQDSADEHIERLNCLDFSISGSTACSASVVCYLFAKALADYNQDLVHLAVLGAVGDRHLSQSRPAKGLNARILDEAINLGWITPQLDYSALHEGNAERIVQAVDALGSFGYFSGGPDIALKGLLEGFDATLHSFAKQYMEAYQEALCGFLDSLEINTMGNISWFTLDERFRNFGVKTVGLVCEELIKQKRVTGVHYVLGFQTIPNEVPGVGAVSFEQVKLSVRVTTELLQRIQSGDAPSVQTLLGQEVREFGAFVDACHDHAGAAVIARGQEPEFLALLHRVRAPL